MTGARDFTSCGPQLRFRIPARGKRPNVIAVTLEGDDTYTVTGSVLRKLTFTTVDVRQGVYADNLRSVFTAMTGLATSL